MQNAQAPSGLRLPYLEAPERAFAMFRELEVFSEDTVVAGDGTRLTVLEAGDPSRPTVLLVNALGVSCLFLAPLAKALARDHHVLTWESRGLPDYPALAGDGDLSVERHCSDAREILAHKGRGAAAVVAYCSGANVAVHAIAHRTFDTGRLCIVSPSMEIETVKARTVYQQTMLPIWKKMIRLGPQNAALIRALIVQNQPPHDGSLESELHQMNNLPFRTDEATYRYAQLQAACLEFDWARLLGRVTVPTLVLHGADDDMIHEETSAAVAAGVAGGSFRNLPDCGHFAIYTSRTLHDHVRAFLDGTPTGASR